MKVTPDTNVLLRATLGDEPVQSVRAAKLLRAAETIALTTPALCELVWVLARGHKVPRPEIAAVLRTLLESGNVLVDLDAARAGLAFLDAGGDFADGVIAYSGAQLGGTTFVTFDRQALDIATGLGLSTATP